MYEQYLHIVYLLNEMHGIFIWVSLERGPLFTFQKYYDFMQHLNPLLMPFECLINALGEGRALSLNSLTVNSKYQSSLFFTVAFHLSSTRGFLASFCLCKPMILISGALLTILNGWENIFLSTPFLISGGDAMFLQESRYNSGWVLSKENLI